MSAGPRARLCTVRKWSDFQGYGFSLQASKGKPGHFLSDVDPQSPAYASGIRNNDFVVEVNGINVLSEPHIEVVNRIKQNPNEVSLLVVNDEARQYFESKQIIIDSHMKDLDKIFCPACNPKSAKAAKKTEPAKEKEAKREEGKKVEEKKPEEKKKVEEKKREEGKKVEEKKPEEKKKVEEKKREEGKKVEEKKPEEKKKVEEKKPEEKKTPEEKKPTEKPKSELAAKPDAKTNELFEIDMATVKVKCSNPRRKEKKPKSSFKQRQEEFNKL
ncbi:unnamed protein product [Calicophoron daubneyi]|uniref:PDZ domain-containing protein n=1 Tax=Calicophoron daubneyi TaxID=300641 RepID=A0AAV2TQ61_CALDB